jgi:hypothetical protein
MANNCYNIITFEGDIETLNKLRDILTPLVKTGLNYENYKEIFAGEQTFIDDYEDYDFRDEHPKWFYLEKPYIDDNQLTINGDSAWTPVSELVGIISHVFKVSARIIYEERGANFAGEQEYNEEGICTVDNECTYWEWQFKVGNFYDEFDFIASHIEDIETFLEENNLKDKVDLEIIKKIYNEKNGIN